MGLAWDLRRACLGTGLGPQEDLPWDWPMCPVVCVQSVLMPVSTSLDHIMIITISFSRFRNLILYHVKEINTFSFFYRSYYQKDEFWWLIEVSSKAGNGRIQRTSVMDVLVYLKEKKNSPKNPFIMNVSISYSEISFFI